MSAKSENIEISNFDNSRAKNSFLGNFDLKIIAWGRLNLRGCSLFQNDKGRWIKLPQRSTKNEMGQWVHSPINDLDDLEYFKRLERAVLELIGKMDITNQSKPSALEKPMQQQPYEDQGLPF